MAGNAISLCWKEQRPFLCPARTELAFCVTMPPSFHALTADLWAS